MPVFSAQTIEGTSFFVQLQQLESKGTCPKGFAGNVLAVCQEAVDRLKIFPAIHSQYTLHDQTHCLRVVQLMASVSASVVDDLNALEYAILILSAYFHDQGMIIDEAELASLKSTDAWKTHEQNWSTEHPNYGEISAKLSDPLLSASEHERTLGQIAELRAAVLSDYLRLNHGERSARFLQQQYGHDPRLIVNGTSIVDLLARVCLSHVRSATSITKENGFHFDEIVGTTKVNTALLAYILRLADILDFDRERTPDSLYRAIQFTSQVSVSEWEKHRSVKGWEIGPTRIAFAAECTHPAYERSIREFLDWIDHELYAANEWGRSLPAEFQQSQLVLPQKVDRSRIGARVDPVTREAIYQYFDLEFSLSRDEIVKLLMTEKLYSDKSLFLRELLQNSLDALRHRKSLYQADGSSTPELLVKFEHFQDDGFDVVRCTDNGVGMDEMIIRRFLTRAGRSYYRSPEFERERTRFKEKNCDFDPCARFGIGFMSCFMFGDEITIHTRKDFGMGRNYGKPLVIEIRGLSGIVLVKAGASDQVVGTTVEIRGRRKSFTVDEWSDSVNLVGVLEGYALATEFPIFIDCRVDAIRQQSIIQPQTASRPCPIEGLEIRGRTTFVVDLVVADPRLRGEVRVCTLSDSNGVPTVKNDEAELLVVHESAPSKSRSRVIVFPDGSKIGLDLIHDAHQVCCDGILVAGRPGRTSDRYRLGYRSCNDGFGDAAFLIDARGDLKPALTPARIPPDRVFHGSEPSWERLFDVAGKAYSLVLHEIVTLCSTVGDPARFWKVAEGYGLDLFWIKLRDVWDYLSFPVGSTEGAIEWVSPKDVKGLRLSFPKEKDQTFAVTMQNGKSLVVPVDVQSLCGQSERVTVTLFYRLMQAMATVTICENYGLELEVEKPVADLLLSSSVAREHHVSFWYFRFAGDLAPAVCVAGRNGFANAGHPLVVEARSFERKAWDELSPIERLIHLIVRDNYDETFSSQAALGSWLHRHRKLLGMLNRGVNWKMVHRALHPPYYVFRPGIGMDVLTIDHFERWASGE